MLLVLGGLMYGPGQRVVQAQDRVSSEQEGPTPRWHLLVDGETTMWPDHRPEAPVDSIRTVSRGVLERMRKRGYYYARIDSVTVDTTTGPTVRLYVHRGPQVRIEELRIEGARTLPVEELRAEMETREGKPLVSSRLEADIQALLDRYEEVGHPLAQIRIEETRLLSEKEPALQVTLEVDEGPALWLERIEVPEEARTSPRLLAHLANLEIGAPLRNYDPEAIQKTLRETRFFQKVGTPELRITPEGGALLYIPVEEEPPGTFDAVLGYLPPSGTRERGRLVGSGHLLLEHLFGGGRRAELSLDRRPSQTSVFEVGLADPYLFEMPLRVEGQFRGEQRDSTYGERTYRLDTGYRIGGGIETTVSLSREVVRPGQAGTRIEDGRQYIPRSTVLFYGVGVRYKRLDREQNPRQGLVVDIQGEQGQKKLHAQQVATNGDTLRVHRTIRQERLQSRVRAYLPISDRQVIAVGGEASVLLSREYDRSDLFRMGGATSLRGYDEDRFLGNVTTRALLEYRLLLDRRSYAYAFGDLGYVERPVLDGEAVTRGWHPGYGIGIQIQTGIGLLTTTYALSPEARTPAHGRVHLGLSVGL